MNKNKTETSEMARRMLTIIAKVLVHDHGIKAEMDSHGSTPTIRTEKGSVVYFNNSGDYRLHHTIGTQHSTFSNPTDLISYLVEVS